MTEMARGKLFLQPLVEPREESALPPMVFIWENEQLSGNAPHASRIERSHALIGIDTIIFLAMNAKNRRIPLVNKLMGTIGVGATGIISSVGIPIRVIIL